VARSHKIYAVHLYDKLVRAFTVKHECKTWLGRRQSLDFMTVTSISDGDSYDFDTKKVSAHDFLKDS
jgi:hypothetical protein